MTPEEILASVLERTGVSEIDFFGRRRSPELTATRAEVILELTKLDLSACAIGRIVRRNHVTVLYWQSPEMRARRSEYYQLYHDKQRPEREQRRAAKAAAAKRLREEEARRKPRKLWFSSLESDEALPPRSPDRSVSVPACLLDDARRRATATRSLTAVAFGDPPPGYSALDRREMRACT